MGAEQLNVVLCKVINVPICIVLLLYGVEIPENRTKDLVRKQDYRH